jgi:integrase
VRPYFSYKVNIYELFDSFVSYILATKPQITPNSLALYIAALRSYFAFYDIDIIPSKFRRKVKMPKLYREDEEPLDSSNIRKILLNCSNRRLKSYLLILASGGMRTKIHIRKEYAKTRIARDIYISDEATQYLKQWIDWKYRDKAEEKEKGASKTANPEDLVFSIYGINNQFNLYNPYIKLFKEFGKLLKVTGMAERKENGIQKRRKITLHSLRRFVKTVISDQTNQDYSEWFLGHNKSPYYTKKELERREIYATKCIAAMELKLSAFIKLSIPLLANSTIL